MLVTLRIKLLEPFLGDQRTPEQIRRFRRREDEILLDMSQWSRAVRQSLEDLHLEAVDPASILFPLTLPVGRTDMYNRKWWEKRYVTGVQRNVLKEELCECIKSGAELSFDVGLTIESTVENKRPATEDELGMIMGYIGKMIGLSPFGSQFKFGRFKVMSIDKK
jgi:hypothetical protein